MNNTITTSSLNVYIFILLNIKAKNIRSSVRTSRYAITGKNIVREPYDFTYNFRVCQSIRLTFYFYAMTFILYSSDISLIIIFIFLI